jgi:glycosyltransferase involved in cell wall biosynthesis
MLTTKAMSMTKRPQKKSKMIANIKKWIYKLFTFTGAKYFLYSYRIDDELLGWVKRKTPFVLYTQLSTFESIRFILELNRITKIPIAIHMMDDWPSIIGTGSLFSRYWSSKIDKMLREIIQKATYLFSISDAMSDEYLKRYGKSFIPFHNCIDLQIWDNNILHSPEKKAAFTFLHAGRIGPGIYDSIITVAKVIESLNSKIKPMRFLIQSISIPDDIAKTLSSLGSVHINPAANYEDIPSIMKRADALVLCNDFNEKSVRFLKFSMPTKAAEYMISKVPIIVYSPSSTAVFSHAKEHKWAHLVGEKDMGKLRACIKKIIDQPLVRDQYVQNAYMFAKENYDIDKVSKQFRESFSE